MKKEYQCGENSRSRDLSSSKRQELIDKAKKMEKKVPKILSEFEIPLKGNPKIVTPKKISLERCRASLDVEPITSQGVAVSAEGKVCVFIACSHSKPGGGWLSGAVAQEESISRESTWGVQCSMNPEWHAQSKSWMGPQGALVLDGVELFSDTPKHVIFAGVAAANKSACPSEKEWKKSTNERIFALAGSISAALDEAESRGCATAVLCTFGTGVFGWDHEECARACLLAAGNSVFKGSIIVAAGNDNNMIKIKLFLTSPVASNTLKTQKKSL